MYNILFTTISISHVKGRGGVANFVSIRLKFRVINRIAPNIRYSVYSAFFAIPANTEYLTSKIKR